MWLLAIYLSSLVLSASSAKWGQHPNPKGFCIEHRMVHYKREHLGKDNGDPQVRFNLNAITLFFFPNYLRIFKILISSLKKKTLEALATLSLVCVCLATIYWRWGATDPLGQGIYSPISPLSALHSLTSVWVERATGFRILTFSFFNLM